MYIRQRHTKILDSLRENVIRMEKFFFTKRDTDMQPTDFTGTPRPYTHGFKPHAQPDDTMRITKVAQRLIAAGWKGDLEQGERNNWFNVSFNRGDLPAIQRYVESKTAPKRTPSAKSVSAASPIDTKLTATQDDPLILSRAQTLVDSGWDGKDEQSFEKVPVGFKNFFMVRGTVSFQESQFSAIRKAAQGLLNRGQPQEPAREPVPLPSAAAAAAIPPSAPAPELDNRPLSQKAALDALKNHLYALRNPCLVKNIVDKMGAFLSEPLDGASRQERRSPFDDPSLPQETREHFKDYFNASQGYKEAVSELKALFEGLRLDNAGILENYRGWKELLILLQIPAIMALKNSDCVKILQFIDRDNLDGLRQHFIMLNELKVLDRKNLNNLIVLQDPDSDLDTLLAEIIDNKPRVKEGIVTFWNQSPEFFINKTLYVNDPTGIFFQGAITGCKKQPDLLGLFLEDGTEVYLSYPSFITFRVTSFVYNKFWQLVFKNSFTNGDIFHFECTHEPPNTSGIQPGQYRVSVDSSTNRAYLSDIQTNENRYLIMAEGNSREIFQMNICPWNAQKKAFENRGVQIGLYSLERMFKVNKKESVKLAGIHAKNAENQIRVKDEKNEDWVRLRAHEQIKKGILEIRFELQDERQKKLLEELLDNLCGEQLLQVNFQLVKSRHPALAEKIESLSRQYEKELKIKRSAEEILRQAVLEANYSLCVSKQDNVLIAQTMELLNNAYKHIDFLRGHQVVLFMGNTGSGKSTTVGLLMGAQVEESSNSVGDGVLQIKENSHFYPKIGQAIGTSETIYTQGFKAKDTSCMLADCPGFNDTRGGDYELCTHISIDQAVLWSAGIKAVVILLPASAFLIDRGNPVIDLIISVRERFPGAFKPGLPNSRIFLAITKQNQVPPDVLAGLKNGTRFDTYYKEANQQIQALSARSDLPSIEATKMRREIWFTLLQMRENSQVAFIDPFHKKQPKQLLNQYANPEAPGLDKGQYEAAMNSEFMQKKFGDCIQLSTHSWTVQILHEYLYKLPQILQAEKEALNRKIENLEDLQFDKERRIARVKQLAQRIQELEGQLRALKSRQGSNNTISSEVILTMAAENDKKTIESERLNLQAIDQDLASKSEKLQEIELTLAAQRKKIDEITRAISEKRGKEAFLSEGEKVTNLWKEIYEDPDYVFSIRHYKKGAREEAFNAVRPLTNDDYVDEPRKQIKVKDYNSSLFETAYINRDYRLVPTDPNERAKFLASGKGGKYIAQIDGLRYKIDLGCSATEDGKKIAYGYQLQFIQGEPFPWISIDHIMPNLELNEAEIHNLHSEITMHESDLIAETDRLKDLENTKTKTERAIKELKGKKTQSEEKIQKSERNKANVELYLLIEEAQKELDQAKIEKSNLENVGDLEAQIEALSREVTQVNFIALKTKSRNLAIIIKTQWESALILRRFAEMILGDRENKMLNATLESCRRFIELFDKHKDTLQAQILQEHGF